MTKLRTLGDVRDAGLDIIAVCHSIRCRYTQRVDLDRVIEAVGSMQSLLPVVGLPHFSERMRCPVCQERGMFIWLDTPKVPDPVLSTLHTRVNNWFGDQLLSTVAAAGHIEVAHAAFDAALRAYPGRRLTLQEGSRVLRDSRWRVVRGGKG